MDRPDDLALRVHRRTFLGRGIAGLGLLGLNSLLDSRLLAAETPASGTGGVVSSGCQVRSAGVPASWIAVSGRQKR